MERKRETGETLRQDAPTTQHAGCGNRLAECKWIFLTGRPPTQEFSNTECSKKGKLSFNHNSPSMQLEEYQMCAPS
jgi:hypothetical protein